MKEIRFIWDSGKAKENRKKHGVSFEEARTAFYDENARVRYDPDHSEDEKDRFILLGVSYSLRLLVVCYCVIERMKPSSESFQLERQLRTSRNRTRTTCHERRV